MVNKSVVRKYVNNFRRRIARHMRPDIGMKCDVHLANIGGAILEFQVGPEVESDDTYHNPVGTIGEALSRIEQRAFGGNLDGFMFGGTNVILEDDRIILIKDERPSEWSDSAANKDVRRVISGQKRQVK